MYKIYKYLNASKCSSQAGRFRLMSREHCPPKFECKMEKSPPDIELERMKYNMTPQVFIEHCPKDPKTFKNIFYFICFPLLLCVFINVKFMAEPEKRPKFVEFSYLRIRRKGYPWDPVRTLFHNPRMNALPDGYEVEVPEDEEYDPRDIPV